MKQLFAFTATLIGLAATVSAASPDLSGIKTVYLLPMSSGLDQYLAVRLTAAGVVQVVTDPQKADAVFTDRIGSNLEQTLEQLYQSKAKDDSKDEGFKATMQPLSRGRGSIFLVDRKTRAVIWSMYALPKSSQADELNHLAQKITMQLGKDFKSK